MEKIDSRVEPEFNVAAELPIDKYREEIVALVNSKQVTIVSAETGAGKSTRVPRFLYDEGYEIGLMTQPRIIAARNVSSRVADQMIEDGLNGEALTGYRTAHEGNSTKDTRVLVMTDGLLLMKLIDKGEITDRDVVLIDEFHERDKNMDVALALCMRLGIKVVIMSATLDIERLEAHCKKVIGDENVGRIDIAGRTFAVEDHVEKEDREKTMSETVYEAAMRGENVMAFVPGRRQARELQAKLESRFKTGTAPVILQLNGDQTPEEQQKCTKSYPNGKIIISTSVGQTSITIPDIDTVVDCGWQRVGEYDTHDTLPIQPCSRATLDQRRGRVGRTKPGKYYQARLDNGPAFPTDGDNFDTPEILKIDLIDIVLRLATAGIRLSELSELFDKPPDATIERAEQRCVKLGALAVKSCGVGYEITDTGKEMVRYPVNMNYARMIVEAAKMSPELQLQMIAAVSVMQVGGIASTEPQHDNWRYKIDHENRSDIIAQLRLFYYGLASTEDERQASGILEQRFLKAKKYFSSISSRANLDPLMLKKPTGDDTESLIDCIITGSEEIFLRYGDAYKGRHGGKRKPSRSSVVVSQAAPIVVGRSLDLGNLGRRGPSADKILVDMTAVDLARLVRVLPKSRVQQTVVGHRVGDRGDLESRIQTVIDGVIMPQETFSIPVMDKATVQAGLEAVFESFMSKKEIDHAKAVEQAEIRELRAVFDDLVDLQMRSLEDLNLVDRLRWVIEDIVDRYEGSTGLATVSELLKLIPNLEGIANTIEAETRAEIHRHAPRTVLIRGKSISVEYFFHKDPGVSYANIEADSELLRDMTEADHEEVVRQLHGRVVLYRAGDKLGASTRFRPFDMMKDWLNRPTKKRGTKAEKFDSTIRRGSVIKSSNPRTARRNNYPKGSNRGTSAHR